MNKQTEIPESERWLKSFTREELIKAFRLGEVIDEWRRTWERVRRTPQRWKFLRDLYAAIEPGILSGQFRSPDFLDWEFTPIELDMWCSIRALGLPFWPQFPVGRFFVDFGDPVWRIALECDGAKFHNAERDAARDAEVKALGWKVIRFPGWQCIKGEDDPASSHRRLIEACWPYYPRLRGMSDNNEE